MISTAFPGSPVRDAVTTASCGMRRASAAAVGVAKTAVLAGVRPGRTAGRHNPRERAAPVAPAASAAAVRSDSRVAMVAEAA